jgi:class 3 adenylate cyclase
LSDPIDYTPTVDQQADDILAVMDELGMDRALLVGVLANTGAVAMAAARAPERVTGLVLVNPYAQGTEQTTSRELHGWTVDEATESLAAFTATYANWGTGASIKTWDPAQDSPYNRRLMALLERCSATPNTAAAYLEWAQSLDISDVLRSVQAPTRVLRLQGNPIPHAAVAHVADLIPDATLHLLPVAKPGSSLGEAWGPISDHIEEAATGVPIQIDADRFFGTVLFTDIVGSTELLAEIGDASYRKLRDEHEREVRRAVEDHGGRLIKVTGDGTLSLFDGPTQAVLAGSAISAGSGELGITVRAGVHTGDMERAGSDVHGMTVHFGARLLSVAGAGDVVVSRVVHDLVAGSGLGFTPRGTKALKGIPGHWELFTLSDEGPHHAPIAHQELVATTLDRATLRTARLAPRMSRAAIRLGNAWQRRRVVHS